MSKALQPQARETHQANMYSRMKCTFSENSTSKNRKVDTKNNNINLELNLKVLYKRIEGKGKLKHFRNKDNTWKIKQPKSKKRKTTKQNQKKIAQKNTNKC